MDVFGPINQRSRDRSGLRHDGQTTATGQSGMLREIQAGMRTLHACVWTKQGAAPMVMNPTVFDKYMRDDITKWAGVIKKANIKLD